jgi:hypothetical protein
MKLFASLFLVALSAAAQGSKPNAIVGPWVGDATVRGQQVPVRLEITGSGNDLHAALLNGPDRSPASSVSFAGNHLVISFNYYAKTIDATVNDGHLAGTFGTIEKRYPVNLSLHSADSDNAGAGAKDISGDWEVAVKSSKGESAWQLRVEPSNDSANVKAVIQRIDGDTGALYGKWTGH